VELFRLLSGGLRYAATTGYYLTALQAGPTRYRKVVLTSLSAKKISGREPFGREFPLKAM